MGGFDQALTLPRLPNKVTPTGIANREASNLDREDAGRKGQGLEFELPLGSGTREETCPLQHIQPKSKVS